MRRGTQGYSGIEVSTRAPSGHKRGDNLLTVILILVTGMTLAAKAPAEWESADRISAAAESVVRKHRRLDPDQSVVRAQTPDTRLRLARCDQPLSAVRTAPGSGARRETVRVACTGAVRWKLYVPVTVTSFEEVMVLRRNLSRGHLITDDDLERRRVDIATQPGGYILATDNAVGYVLTQSVSAGSVLRPGVLKANDAIRRGQSVALLSGADQVAIRMGGVAMESAPIGGRITARNASSGTIVEGIVLNEKEIRVTGRR